MRMLYRNDVFPNELLNDCTLSGMNHEEIYQVTVRQVLAGEADHLDDLIYDPVVL